MFMSNDQQIIDTLRLIFNCNQSKRVEWELIKSINYLPHSPCPQQINFLRKDYFHLNILVSLFDFILKEIYSLFCF